ncbi:MAG: hypothetical protein AB8F74_00760 [Saprospiraceae bacterium]
MKKIIYLFFFLCSLNLYGQQFLNGFVLDSLGKPLQYGATVTLFGDSTLITEDEKGISTRDSLWIEPVHYLSYSDNTGAFHVLVEKGQNINLKVKSFGYVDNILRLDSIPSKPVKIMMAPDSLPLKPYQSSKRRNWYNVHPTTISMGMDFHQKNHDEFISILGEDNVEALNLSPFNFTIDYGKVFNRVYTAIEFGLTTPSVKEENGRDIEISSNLFAIHLGYELINTCISYVLPKVSLIRYRTRLINSPDGGDVPIQNFLESRDLDLRFISPIADFGLTIGYKFRGKDWIPGAFIIAGVHGGYTIPLNRDTKIKGLRSSISSEEQIQNSKLHLNFFFRSYFLEW